jgi:P-type Ca2+ transporter type 2C
MCSLNRSNRKQKEDRKVKVIRGGRTVLISVYEILVGDILLLEAGDIVPVDGVLAEGQDVRCDESSVSGESDTVKKVTVNVAIEHTGAGDAKSCDPFILSGTKVLEGVGKCVVTAVGTNSCYGRMMQCTSTPATQTDRC